MSGMTQTQDSQFRPWRSEAEHATSRSRRLPTILSFTSGWGTNIFASFKPPRSGNEPRTLAPEHCSCSVIVNKYTRCCHKPGTLTKGHTRAVENLIRYTLY